MEINIGLILGALISLAIVDGILFRDLSSY